MRHEALRVLVIAGPTAVGKSNLAMQVCAELHGEIISADSVQLYRGLDIGSNKPDAAARSAVPHHVIDVGEADDPWTAGRWSRAAMTAIDDCGARGVAPVVVGGTMMYVKWLTRGAPDAPPASAETAKRAADMLPDDWDQALRLLASFNPERAEKLSKNDWYRLSRALEIELSTEGRRARDLFLADARYDARCVFIAPDDRMKLFRRIDERCDQMLEDGLVAEVAGLAARGKLPPTSTAARAIGYRQTLEFLESRQRDDASYFDFCAKFATATRNYATEQLKWYRKDPNFAIVPGGADAVDTVLRFFRAPRCDYDAWLAGMADARAALVADPRQMRTYNAHPPLAATDALARQRQFAFRDAAIDLLGTSTPPRDDTTNRLAALQAYPK